MTACAGSASSAASAVAKNAGEGLPTTVASMPAAASRPSRNAPPSSRMPPAVRQ
jgi:hypothetical protein